MSARHVCMKYACACTAAEELPPERLPSPLLTNVCNSSSAVMKTVCPSQGGNDGWEVCMVKKIKIIQVIIMDFITSYVLFKDPLRDLVEPLFITSASRRFYFVSVSPQRSSAPADISTTVPAWGEGDIRNATTRVLSRGLGEDSMNLQPTEVHDSHHFKMDVILHLWWDQHQLLRIHPVQADT